MSREQTDEGYVAEAEWALWDREREAENALYAARCRWESAKPVELTRDELLLQLHALRVHNEWLVAELERVRGLALGYVLGQIRADGR